MNGISRDTLTDLAWIGAWFALLILAGYGLRDPWPADEPRFAGVALDMVRSGNWLIPHAGGDLYQDKPPLHFWLMSVGFLLTHSLRLGFLLPSMLASLGTLLLVYDLVRRLHGHEAGRLAALTLVSCIHFVMTTRGAQIDATLIFFCTLALWGLMRHVLQGAPLWVALLGAFGAGLGVIDKAVGVLALVLLPLAAWLAGRMGSRKVRLSSVIPVLAIFVGTILLWLVPMLWHVASEGTPELAAYRDEILFQQTVTRYTQAWHHIRPWYYYFVEVIPVLWLPLSALLIWLVPRWRTDWREGRAAVWLPLLWAIFVIAFFSVSTGKRGVYILPALPALAIAAAPHLSSLFALRAVQRMSWIIALFIVVPGVVLALGSWFAVPRVVALLSESELSSMTPVYVFAVMASVVWVLAWKFKPLLAWPSVLACLTLTWGFGIAPQINGERSASEFIRRVTAVVPKNRELGLLAYKEQFLLYLDRDTVNFGHARWREGDAEAFDAARWLAGSEQRVLLVPEHFVETCFSQSPREFAGMSSGDRWYLVTGRPSRGCVERGNPDRVIRYPTPKPL
ncbi:MAG: ArnT family glycosyltransferase [Gammaproteobacteria bacterium]